jgi:hypothetical protein
VLTWAKNTMIWYKDFIEKFMRKSFLFRERGGNQFENISFGWRKGIVIYLRGCSLSICYIFFVSYFIFCCISRTSKICKKLLD